MRGSKTRNIRWKKWPLIGLLLFVACLVLMLTALFNDLENQTKKKKIIKKEFNPYATEKTKIIIPKDEDETEEPKRNIVIEKEVDVRPFPNENNNKNNNKNQASIPAGYKRWEEPESKLSNANSPGERGIPVKISADESEMIAAAYEEYGFNQYVSDKISLHRSVPDIRPISCHFKTYQSELSKVSVIIIFHNEGWSTLLRTVHSVLDRTPKELLHEIILCDDFSVKEHLKEKLKNYLKTQPKVKLVRTKEREGLIRARLLGASHSTGDVLLFLDSHCEANAGWLPPLLSEIQRDYRTVVCPIIDVIDHRTFSYRAGHSWTRGTFSWRFDYKERSISAEQYLMRKDEADPVPSPVMAGGLFAISRKFWEELGKYDPNMYVWGGEQYEISFKLWMCGGRMFNVPCSRVGHVYRDRKPYKSNKLNAALINFKRVAEVWMDDFKHFLYHYREDIGVQDHGDVSERLALRERLQCKSFEWYLANVANDTIRTRYEPNRALGWVKNLGSELCVDFNTRATRKNWPLVVSECESPDDKQNQILWTYIFEIRFGLTEMCAEGDTNNPTHIYEEHCHETGGNQAFFYDEGTKQISHKSSRTCLQSPAKDDEVKTIKLAPCNVKLATQQWELSLTNDVNGPVPEWAKVADEFYKKYTKKKKRGRIEI